MIAEFLDNCKRQKALSENTLNAYRKHLTKFAAWLKSRHEGARWSAVTQQEIEEYVCYLNQRGESASSVKAQMAAIRSLYMYFVRKGMLTDSPARYVSTPKRPARLPKVMAWEDIRAALKDASTGLETRAQIAIMAESGMRISEVLAMTWEQASKNVLRVVGKGNKERLVQLGASSRRLLAALRQQRDGKGQIFSERSEREYRYLVWQGLRKHTDAEKCSPHVLRHTFATQQLLSGTDLVTLSTMMGHSSTTTTERYTHIAGIDLVKSFTKTSI